jgi:hypothetical protein
MVSLPRITCAAALRAVRGRVRSSRALVDIGFATAAGLQPAPVQSSRACAGRADNTLEPASIAIAIRSMRMAAITITVHDSISAIPYLPGWHLGD